MGKEFFMIIDGNSLVHRAFHAIPLLTTSQGTVTNAVYGFAVMLLKILNEKKPHMIAVCFDKGKKTFRHDEYETYKATRKATPDELRPQFPLIKEMLSTMGIAVIEMDNYEADDLIGTMITLAEKENIMNVIVTGDRDALQLVSGLTTVLLTKKGITELDEYDEKKVRERYGLSPLQLIDLKGVVGDVSDNIPGVPGIGEKTGVKLIEKFGSLEVLLDNLDQISNKQADKIKKYADQARLSKKLANIIKDVPIDIKPCHCRWSGPDYNKILPLFNKLEFKSLIKNITSQLNYGIPQIKTYQVEYLVLKKEEEFQMLKLQLAGRKIGLALEGSRKEGLSAVALSISDGKTFYIPITSKEALEFIIDISTNPNLDKICFDAKSDMWIMSYHEANLNGVKFDVAIAAYLLNPGSPNLDLSDLSLEHLKIILPSEGLPALCSKADAIRKLAGLLDTKITEAGMENLYYQVELSLVHILTDMEIYGVKVDQKILTDFSIKLGERISQVTETIYVLAEEKFNINSTRQLGKILFEKLQLPVIKKTKTGYSTDAAVLEELAESHDIVRHIILHRHLMKLKSTYVDGLLSLINPYTGLVHTTFHQNITATGRLSSSEPNLQNIPIRLEEGRKIRKVFIPRRETNKLLAADYSQIELRILAHMSGDPVLMEAFKENQDIHTRTASEVFGVAIQEVTNDMRGKAKAVNFGIIYGISDFGLARDINVTRQEANIYIQNYFKRHCGAKFFIDKTINDAREKGYVTTILNRRRYLPDLFSTNRTVRNFGERAAINTPIQGSAADIIKLAMVKIWEELNKRQLKTLMILQVHDELIFDVPIQEMEEVKKLVQNCMENAIKLNVPLKVDMKTGLNWYDIEK